ncbi:MAG: tRNA (adenosine(37)-N6)-dimethylallyltransferase MiaA [bacterium]
MDTIPTLLVIAGPTATGKSRLALHCARQWCAEIVSADSRQIYRHMDIGTGKPTPEEQALVPHHMIDIVEPDQTYSAGEYGRSARSVIDALHKNGTLPILVGGTGLYIRAVIDGLAPSPPSDPRIKGDLLRRVENEGIHTLHRELMEVDPRTAERLHPNDRQRILRAIEVFRITGRRLSDFHQDTPEGPGYRTVFFVLSRPRPELYELIDTRIDGMFAQGLIEEVQYLIERGYTPDHPGMQSIGYSRLYAHLTGRISLAEARFAMKQDTQRYAKRQMTWFRKETRAHWLDIPAQGDVLDMVSTLEWAVYREEG